MTTPKHCVFIPFFFVCFIKAENPLTVREPANLEKSNQMAETLLAENLSSGRKPTNVRKPTNGGKPIKWQKTLPMAETLPTGRNS